MQRSLKTGRYLVYIFQTVQVHMQAASSPRAGLARANREREASWEGCKTHLSHHATRTFKLQGGTPGDKAAQAGMSLHAGKSSCKTGHEFGFCRFDKHSFLLSIMDLKIETRCPSSYLFKTKFRPHY